MQQDLDDRRCGLTKTAAAPPSSPPPGEFGSAAGPPDGEPGWPGAPSRARRLVGWSVLIAALTGVIGLLLSQRLFYGNDDLLQFDSAREHGLSWTTLSLNVFQHFAPYNRLTHLAVYELSDLSPTLGLTFVLGNLALMLAASLWLMTELELSTSRRIVALVWTALLVPVTDTAIWFDGGIHIPPAIAVTMAVCAAHVRAVRRGSWRWHAVALLLFVLGQLTQERPALALPLLVLVDMLLLWRALPWAERFRRLWEQRWPVATLLVAALGIAAALKAWVVMSTNHSPSWAVTFRTMLSALSNYALPSLVNQPLRAPLGPAVELVVLGAAIVVGLVLARLRRGNGDLLLFLAATFVLYYGFLKFSPILTEDTVTANAERLNYAFYVAVPGIIALVQLRLPRPRTSSQGAAAGRRPASTTRRSLRVAACLGVAAYLLMANSAYLDRQWAASTQARAWLDEVRANAAVWGDPAVTLVPLHAPQAMTTAWARPFGREDWLFGLVRKDYRPGALTDQPVLVDDTGTVRPAVLDPVRPSAQLIGGACEPRGRTLGNKADLVVRPVRGAPLLVALRYRATQDMDVRLSAGWDTTWAPNRLPSFLPAGSHTVLLPVESSRLESSRLEFVDLQGMTEGAAFCVSGAEVVRPMIELGDGNGCQMVDVHGRPEGLRSCP
jgi:hypothetical protein